MKAQTKKVFEDTVSTVKTQFGEAERVWSESIERLNTRFQDAEKLARRIEADGREKLDKLKAQIQLDTVKGRFDGAKLVEQGVRLGAETAEFLGLAQLVDLNKVSGKLDRLVTKVETVRRRTTEITDLKKAAKNAARVQAKTEKRLMSLEKSITDLSKQLKATAKKPGSKKPAAKKTATTKTSSKSRSTKR
jgi:hypothetical protein